MVIDFSKVHAMEMPVLILRNLDGTAIQTLGCAYNLKADICYNDVSSITFDLPRYVDGVETPRYKDVIGTRIVDMDGWGQFILMDPSTDNDGIQEIKSCKAYSLEYEFTKKKMSLEDNTYNFWNPTAQEETILSIILEYMPSWSIGTVDSELIGKYRTFSVSNVNVYDFIKSTLQKTYSCIFEFDTYTRTINVRHTNTESVDTPVYISMDNLAKKLTIQEDTKSIVTSLDVNGADGVDIRNVNPLGTNKIYNLDYYMNTTHFEQAMIDKWNAWKAACEQYELPYYNVSVERMLKSAEILTKQSEYNEIVAVDLAVLQNEQAAKIEYLARLASSCLYVGLSSTPPTDVYGVHEPSVGGYERVHLVYMCKTYPDNDESDLYENSTDIVFPTATGTWFDGQGDELCKYWVLYDSPTGGNAIAYGTTRRAIAINAGYTMRFQDGEITFHLDGIDPLDMKSYIQTLVRLQELRDEIDAVNDRLDDLDNELRYLEQDYDALTAQMVGINQACSLSSFFTEEELLILDRYFIEDSISEASFVVSNVKDYTDAGYSVNIQSAVIEYSDAEITQSAAYEDREIFSVKGGTITFDEPGIQANVIRSAIEITEDDKFVLTANLGSGTIDGASFPSGCISVCGTHYRHQDDLTPDEEVNGAIATGTAIQIDVTGIQLYFTRNTTQYEQYSVEWDLLEYGRDCLSKLAYPSFSFNVSSENFFALEQFSAFVDSIQLGQRIYLQVDEDSILNPIFVKASLSFDDLPSLSLEFSNTFNASDNAFKIVDLLEQSISMGKTVDTSRFNYNAFIDSGAATTVKDFMDSALDVSKNAVLSGSGMEISWDASGFHCRKPKNSGGYEPEEIAIVNNSIVFTDDGWKSAKMAIGHFVDANTGDAWGIVAPNITGTLLAGQNLVIESKKKDGDMAVFRVDGDGAVLHNARFDIEDANRHIVLDPKLGFAIGAYPVITTENGEDVIDIGTTANPGNAKFWVDTNGDVYIRGTLEGCDGTFSGALSGGTISIGNGNFAVDASGNLTANNGTFKGTVYGATYKDSSGNNMMNANSQFTAGYLDLHGLTIKDNNNNTTFQIDQNGNTTIKGSLDGCDGTFSGSMSWTKTDEDGQAVGSVSFTNGNDGQKQTTLITLGSNRGILLDAAENIGIKADSIWAPINASHIHISKDGGGGFISLKAYIKSVIDSVSNGTYSAGNESE